MLSESLLYQCNVATLTQWFGQNDKFEWLNDLSMLLNPGQPLYLLVYAVAIIFFSFFYTAMQYNPRDTADNLKKSGAFIPGIRPGEQTSRYIDKVMTRLTLIGGLYVNYCPKPLRFAFFNADSY